jgi:formamidopyrimidine-DNA glycosylase
VGVRPNETAYDETVPELPDVVVYLEALERHIIDKPVTGVRIKGISALRSFDPPIDTIVGRSAVGVRRLGKRLILDFDNDLYLVIHLMVAGRLHWKKAGAGLGKIGVAAIDVADGSLVLDEAASKKRARLWLVQGEEALLEDHDRGGAEPLEISATVFGERLTARNRTLKRGLTDPTIFSGIGNAYSDEILWAAGLSPVKRSQSLTDDEIVRLHQATVETLKLWLQRFRDEVGDGFPKKVTAFRPDMAVHGRFGEPCPTCGTSVARIVYASNEVNYCPTCQNQGRILADRSLSRLLKEDWPRTVEELEGESG